MNKKKLLERLAAARMDSALYFYDSSLSCSQLLNCGIWTPSESRWTPHLRYSHKSSDAMSLGTLIHSGYYEDLPPLAARPTNADGDLVRSNSKAYSQWLESLPQGVQIVKQDEIDTIHRVLAALRSPDSLAHYAYMRGVAQSLATEECYRTTLCGHEVRIKPDNLALHRDGRVIIEDLKTTEDCSPDEFRRSAHKWGYFRRCAFYRSAIAEILGIDTCDIVCVLIAAQTNGRSDVAVYEINDIDLDESERVNADALEHIDNSLPLWLKEPQVLSK